ncbi:MAG: carboxyl transferase [Lachnospiraceae bacterium]|nr:carboxyl transferase [Lachnospiraceae bacterium]
MSGSSDALRRIEAILDEKSFVEIGAGVSARNTDFLLNRESTPSDGVITGYGVIEGRLVYIFSQDASVLGGSVGEMHARKIARLYDLALKCGAPVIGLIDSSGMRLQESVDAMYALGSLYGLQSRASGVVPQITAVYGNCGGGLAVYAAMSDFTFIEEKNGRLFVNAPNTIDENYREKCDTSAAAFQSEKAGTIDAVCDEASIADDIRALVSMLPSNNEDDESFTDCEDDLNRRTDGIEAVSDDPAKMLAMIADGGIFCETKREYAPEMACGFIRLNGATCGVIANRVSELDDSNKKTVTFGAKLTEAGCVKAARLVRFCDAFGIPVLTIGNVEGFAATMCEERRIALHAAQLVSALQSATVPKVSLVTKKAIGSAALVMNAVTDGADMRFAWPSAQIGAMEAKMAAKILGEGKSEDEVKELEAGLTKLQNSAQSAAARGCVDELIEPADTRKHIIYAFEMLYTKRDDRPARKHGTV